MRTSLAWALAAASAVGLACAPSSEHSHAPGEVADLSGLDVEDIATGGASVVIEDHLVANKITVVDFHASWCAPCKQLDVHMAHVLREHPDVAVRKIEVVDWDSPSAKELLVGVPELPHVMVYAADGHRVARVTGLQLSSIDRAIDRARDRARERGAR